mmetsp:Transcript_7472/g.14608  ORF Transcript_7472/g.14608 Transcript_7472/m.14608 type:complete len:180 (-) Transcript_7472:124-663(-)
MAGISDLGKEAFEVAESRLRGAGLGLYAKVDIPENTVLCYYTGKVLSLMKVLRARDTDYVMGLSLNVHVDAKDYPDVLARYINDHGDPRCINAKFVKEPKLRRAAVVSIKRICAGCEIYASYGQSYWRKRGGIPIQSIAAKMLRCYAVISIGCTAVWLVCSRLSRITHGIQCMHAWVTF